MKTFLFTLFTVLVLVAPLGSLHAQQRQYQLLAPLPNVTDSTGKTTNFSTYLTGAYKLFFGIAGILAVIMIIAGGFQYATTDAIQNKEEGRVRVKNAILGLLLALGSYIILYTIDPELLEFKIQAPSPELSLPAASTPSSNQNNILDPKDWSSSEASARLLLDDGRPGTSATFGDELEAKGACKPGVYDGCVTLAGLPSQTFTQLKNLEKECGCQIYITGGAEGPGVVHQTHGPGQPVVDIVSTSDNAALINYITTSTTDGLGSFIGNSNLGPVYQVGGNQYLMESDHVHACIGAQCNVTYSCRAPAAGCTP